MIPAPARRLLDFIGSKEAPRGYDTVFGNRMKDMPQPITSMTVDAVIADGQRRYKAFGSSAAGRYQFMPNTLRSLKQTQRLTGSERMTAAFQDELGYALLLRRGYRRFVTGGMSVVEFGLQLAQEWASFPVLRDTKGEHRQVTRGQSYYAGDGLNKALVSADEVERFLNTLRAEPTLTVAPAPAVIAPKVETVPSETVVDLPWWARLLGRKPAAPAAKERPGLHPKGSPELWDVQKALRDRAYYTKGFLDGLDGQLTQEAVAQARKDAGLGDGGIDAAFLAALPAMPQRPVAAERAKISLGKAAQHAPELFGPAKWLGTFGAGLLGLGGADGAGLLDNVQGTFVRINDTADKVQTGLGYVTSIVAFLVEHKTLVFIGLGLFLVVKAAGYVLDAWIKVRQAFF